MKPRHAVILPTSSSSVWKSLVLFVPFSFTVFYDFSFPFSLLSVCVFLGCVLVCRHLLIKGSVVFGAVNVDVCGSAHSNVLPTLYDMAKALVI